MPLPEASLRWILAQDGVTSTIPGASSGEQASANAAAGSEPTAEQAEIISRFDVAVRETYEELLREAIHPRSEERRVGKECRYGWCTEERRKKAKLEI